MPESDVRCDVVHPAGVHRSTVQVFQNSSSMMIVCVKKNRSYKASALNCNSDNTLSHNFYFCALESTVPTRIYSWLESDFGVPFGTLHSVGVTSAEGTFEHFGVNFELIVALLDLDSNMLVMNADSVDDGDAAVADDSSCWQ